MIFLDNNATTPIFPEILSELLDLYKHIPFLNPSPIHVAGRNAKRIIDEAKSKIASSLNAKCHEIYFTSSATESNNMVLNCANFESILTIKTEHDSILQPASKLNTKFIEIDSDGIVNLNDLENKVKQMKSPNFLCSISYANNESGVIQDLPEIAKIVRAGGGGIHTDASQIIGKRRFDFAIEDVDIITFSGHKFHAGLGAGVAIFRSGLDIKPLILGGGQQNFKRAGTENVPAIFALGESLSKVNSVSYLAEYSNKVSNFQKMIEISILNAGGDVFAKTKDRIYNTSLIFMPKISNLIQLIEFDLNNICVSAGSACSSGKVLISHVLKACFIPEERAKNFIRVSTSMFNSFEEIEKFLEVWHKLLKRSVN